VANAIEDKNRKQVVFLTVFCKETYSLLSNLVAPEKPEKKLSMELDTGE